MLRGAASRVGPLPLRLRKGAHFKCYKWAGVKLKQEVLVNDTTLATPMRPPLYLKVVQLLCGQHSQMLYNPKCTQHT